MSKLEASLRKARSMWTKKQSTLQEIYELLDEAYEGLEQELRKKNIPKDRRKNLVELKKYVNWVRSEPIGTGGKVN